MLDCYDMPMDKKTSFILCNEHGEIRALQKNMLIQHGYFHIQETTSSEEAISLLKQGTFLLLPIEKLTSEMKDKLKKHHHFIIFTNAESINHTAVIELGIRNTISFPYSSESLIERIKSILN